MISMIAMRCTVCLRTWSETRGFRDRLPKLKRDDCPYCGSKRCEPIKP